MRGTKRSWLPLLLLLLLLTLGGCAAQEAQAPETTQAPEATQAAADLTWDTLAFDHRMALSYAEQFTVDSCEGGYQKITIGESASAISVST